MTGAVVAVCVVRDERDSGVKRVSRTAIDKRAVPGRVAVGRLGLGGDYVCDTEFHGGQYQAVYAYQLDEAQRWATELGRELHPGWFGENLLLSAMSVTDAVVGERWHITGPDSGDVLELEVTGPRTPCGTFGVWSGEKRWVKRFTERADVGAYLRVNRTGTIGAGDTVTRVHVPAHGVTVRDVFTATDPQRLRRLLAGHSDLAPSVVDHVTARIERESGARS
ncbi:MOSC domain-containing protein YiiM [Rhodococcus sp. 27YEA15]|uniref:MOSC domain-containing protein n=1 Tax=Rhodococcus sp. 27YEA15 TaxID=3156259 RepID=UPI003C7B3197